MLELVSPQAWAKAFGLPEILMMKELHQRAPMLLRTSVLSCDCMRDTAEDVLFIEGKEERMHVKDQLRGFVDFKKDKTR